jgi:hypothetical protein
MGTEDWGTGNKETVEPFFAKKDSRKKAHWRNIFYTPKAHVIYLPQLCFSSLYFLLAYVFYNLYLHIFARYTLLYRIVVC